MQARTEGRNSTDEIQAIPYTVTNILPVSSVNLSTNPEDFGVADESTTINAAAGRPFAEYRFLCKHGDEPYELLQEWSGDADCVWTPVSEGQYTLLVLSRARQQNSVQAVATLSYWVLALPPVKDVVIETDPEEGQELGGTVEITAHGDQPDAQYEFAYLCGDEYIVVQDFSADASYTWMPETTGFYSWRVRARTDTTFPEGQAEALMNYAVYTEVTIPDAALRAGLLNTFGKASDGIITNLDMASLTNLDCSGWGIEDLTGIDYAMNIVDLNLSDNHITSLFPLQALIDAGGLTDEGCHLDITENGLDCRENTSAKSMIDAWASAGLPVDYLPQHPVVGSVTLDIMSPGEVGTEIIVEAHSDKPGVEYRFTVDDSVLTDWTDEETVAWTPDTAGIHTITVQARTWGMPETQVMDSIQYEVIPTPLSDVTIKATPDSFIEEDSTVIVSAVGEAGAWYQFQITGEGESTVWDWSQNDSIEWTPERAGHYDLYVQAHRDGRPADCVDVSDTMEYEVVPKPLTGELEIDVSPESPQDVGTEITISVDGLGSDAEYWFGVQTAEEEWVWTGEWSTETSVSWMPDDPGIYIIYVRTRAQGRDGFDLEDTIDFTVSPPPLGDVTLSVNPGSPQAAGTEIILTAQSEGVTPEYCFSVKAEEGKFEDIRDWEENNTCTWIPDVSGTYTLRVQAREFGQTTVVAEDSLVFLVAWPSVEILTLDIDEETTYQHQSRRLSATANTDYAEFKFSVQNPDFSWDTLQGWSEDAECEWTPYAAGEYILRVEGRGLGRIGSDISETMTVSVYPSPPVREWSAYFGGNGLDESKAVKQTSDGGFILAGSTRSSDIPGYSGPSGKSDAYLVKTDMTGNMQWQFCIGGDRNDTFRDVIQTDDGGYLAIGQKEIDALHASVYIVKVSGQGYREWENSYAGAGRNDAYSIIRTVDGNYCITGYVCDTGFSELSRLASKRLSTGIDGFVLKIKENSQPIWLKYYGGNGSDYLYDLVQSSDGTLICVGDTRSTDLDNNYHGGNDGWVVKTNSSGILQWQRAIGGSGLDCLYSTCIRFSGGQERYEIVGTTQSNNGDLSGYHGSYDGLFLSINSSGNTILSLCLGGSDNDQFSDIIINR